MKPTFTFTTAVIILVLIFTGCSHGLSTVDPGFNGSPGDEYANADSSHSLWGIWTFICNPGEGSVEIIPLRETELHLNALKFLEPPPYVYLTLESPPVISGGVLDVDIGLRNPFVGQKIYTGFDVYGIVFAHGTETGYADPDIVMAGEGDTRLLNADGYTRWWNPAEFPHGDTVFSYIDGLLGTPADQADFNCTINGYKYYADGLGPDDPLTSFDPAKRGVFGAGKKNIRHYTVDLSGGLVFNYAVDICWMKPAGSPPYTVPDDFPPEANRTESYNISVTVVENSLYYVGELNEAGGHLRMLVDVWDHYNASVNEVYAESLSGIPDTPAFGVIGGGDGYCTYEIQLPGEYLIRSGEAELLISVRSEAKGYGGILPGKWECSYFMHSFNIRNYPPGWVVTWGNNFSTEGCLVTVDHAGYICVAGRFTHGIDLDPGKGEDVHHSEGLHDISLSKFDPSGEYLWGRDWGGIPEDYVTGIDTDSAGNIYVTGYFSGTCDFDPGPGIEEHTSGEIHDAFLSKFSPDGDFLWVSTWGGNEYGNLCNDVAISVDDTVYVTGYFRGVVDFDPGPELVEHSSNNNSADIFLCMYDPDGLLQWVRTCGGASGDVGNRAAVDSFGDVYIAGSFLGVADFDPGPGLVERSSMGQTDSYLLKMSAGGDFVWVRTWGGPIRIRCENVAVDDLGSVYVAGEFYHYADFDPGPGEEKRTAVGNDANIYLTKLDQAGSFHWVQTWGADQADTAFVALTLDSAGDVYVGGVFEETVDFNPGPIDDEHTSNGLKDGFLSKFSKDGEFQFVRTWGGSKSDYVYDIAGYDRSSIYVTGRFRDLVDFDPGPDVYHKMSIGNTDAFLCKLGLDGYW